MTITSLLVAVQNDDDSTDDISRTIAQNQEEYHRKDTHTHTLVFLLILKCGSRSVICRIHFVQQSIKQ